MLLQPPAGHVSPGNPTVQAQLVKFNGIIPLVNCCTYDDNNPFAKERVTVCLKWLLDGSRDANEFFRKLIRIPPGKEGENLIRTLAGGRYGWTEEQARAQQLRQAREDRGGDARRSRETAKRQFDKRETDRAREGESDGPRVSLPSPVTTRATGPGIEAVTYGPVPVAGEEGVGEMVSTVTIDGVKGEVRARVDAGTRMPSAGDVVREIVAGMGEGDFM